ncbi:MAG TPA: PilZ domain-containing protein [Nitrospira sp.]|jgi:hypothetical protein|nr:PilZ domain-containing protein [Nitrospira sp.]
MTSEQRQSYRVGFNRGVEVQIVAIDGTWARGCEMLDVSETGAKLALAEVVEGLTVTEFFLVLSSFGTAFHRCRLVWMNGSHLGVSFIGRERRKQDS